MGVALANHHEAKATAASPISSERSGLQHAPENAITVSNVTVGYRAYNNRPSSLKEALIRFFRERGRAAYSTFDALSNISLSVPRGAVFALVGSNGCGKSTLLKVIAGVLPPTKGTVTVTGEVASLIELGAGFDPELTAIENIYLNGSLHKRPRSFMESRVEQILEFAELKEFAHTPIKYFSSGMFARLGFSVAVDVNPDILLVDEILSVGDERFQAKCGVVFERFIAEGKTIILVTHDMELVQKRASRAALIERGTLRFCGDPAEAIALYRGKEYHQALG